MPSPGEIKATSDFGPGVHVHRIQPETATDHYTYSANKSGFMAGVPEDKGDGSLSF